MLKKLFRPGKLARWHEKETIDEITFRTTKVRNRLCHHCLKAFLKDVLEYLSQHDYLGGHIIVFVAPKEKVRRRRSGPIISRLFGKLTKATQEIKPSLTSTFSSCAVFAAIFRTISVSLF